MATQADTRVMAHVEGVLRKIASVQELAGQFVVNVPVMYPSGTMVVVSVEENHDKFLVSDLGHGLTEAEYYGAQHSYGKVATEVAELFGVEFDGNSILALWVAVDRLEAAIVCIANASSRAAQESVRVASEVQAQRKDDQLFDRVSAIFGQKSVSRSRLINGRHVQWKAKNVVVVEGGKLAIFEYMTTHVNSVSSAFLMFSDIRQSEEKISLNVVVQNISGLDAKGQMISEVANIVEMTASDDQFRRYALAA